MNRLFDEGEKVVSVKVIELNPSKEVQKEIFCLTRNESEWNNDCYNEEVNSFTKIGLKIVYEDFKINLKFVDEAYHQASVHMNDYIIKVSDTFNLIVSQEEMHELGIAVCPQICANYLNIVKSITDSQYIKSKRKLQILAALLGKKWLCFVYGEEHREENNKTKVSRRNA